MVSLRNKFSRFWQELKHRKTDRVVVAYAASAFVILQLTEIFADALSLPSYTKTLIIIVLAIGFPISAIFSWFFDITPGGIEKTKPLGAKKRQQIEAELKTWKGITLVSIIVIIALLLLNIISKRIESDEIRRAQKSLAVLPFEVLSPDEELPINSDGITTIITTGLSEIKELDVRPRSVVLEYKNVLEKKNRNKSISNIAKKLKVFFVVTGELVKSGNKILVSVNLLMAKKEKVIWARNYTINQENNFEEISEIILGIANSLKTAPTLEERRKISSKPTQSGIAYINYIKASASQDDANSAYNYLSKGDSIFKDLVASEYFDKAIEFYGKAIKADTNFALAYAKRAITRAWGYNTGYFKASDHQEKCKTDIDRAIHINKNLTEAKVAYGFYYYYFIKDYNVALEYFKKASLSEPETWQLKYYVSLVLRAAGDWERSQKLVWEVAKNNIQDPLFLTNIGISYQSLHQYDSAIYYHDKAIEMMPKWSAPYQNKIESLILRDGNTKEAEIVLDSAVLRTTGGQFPKDKIIFDLYNKKYEEALVKAENTDLSYFDNQGDKYLVFAKIYNNLNDQGFAAKYYNSAFSYFSEKLKENAENTYFLSLAGISAAGLNDKKKALEYGQTALKLTGNNYMEKSWRTKDLAQIFVMLGEYDKALILIEELLNNPSDFSINILQIDPVWKPLQKKAEFRKMIENFSKI
jgi:TolB-like protein